MKKPTISEIVIGTALAVTSSGLALSLAGNYFQYKSNIEYRNQLNKSKTELKADTEAMEKATLIIQQASQEIDRLRERKEAGKKSEEKYQ